MKRLGIVLCTGLAAACGAGSENVPDTEQPPLPPETPVGESTAIEGEAQPGPTMTADLSACPTELEGVQVRSEMTADGAALVFTTDTGDVSELQARVRMLSQRQNEKRARAGMGGEPGVSEPGTAEPGMGAPDTGQPDTGMSGGAQGMQMHEQMLHQARSRVEEMENGARLVLTPDDPTRLSMLREHVRMHGAELIRAECPQEQPLEREVPSGTMTPPPTAPPSPDQPLPGQPIPERPLPDQPLPDQPITPDQPVEPDPTMPDPPSPSPDPGVTP